MPMLQENLFNRTWPLTVFATEVGTLPRLTGLSPFIGADWTFEEYGLPWRKRYACHHLPLPRSGKRQTFSFTPISSHSGLLPLGIFLKKNIFYSPKNRFLENTIPLSGNGRQCQAAHGWLCQQAPKYKKKKSTYITPPATEEVGRDLVTTKNKE